MESPARVHRQGPLAPDWPEAAGWASFNALVARGDGDLPAAFAHAGAATDPAYRNFAQALESSRPATGCFRASCLAVAAVGFFSLLVSKGSPALVSGPRICWASPACCCWWVPGLAPLMQAQRQRTAQIWRCWLDKVSGPTKNLLVIGYMR